MAKLRAARCPTCGANLQIPPNAPHVTCRYCGNLITIEHKKPPPMQLQMQMQGVPSRTLYIDPEEAARAGRSVGCMIMGITLVTVLLPLTIGLGPMVVGRIKRAIRPFPAECGVNEQIELSGDFSGTGPVIASAGVNCKILIKKSHLKGSTLLKTSASNVEVTLVDTTVETTEGLVDSGSNMKVSITGGTVKSGGTVLSGDSNLKVTLENTTIESTGDTAIKTGYNLKLSATNAKIIGKKAALDTKANADLTLKKGSEIASAAGTALKTESGLKMDAEGGKIEGGEGAIVATSGAKITAQGTAFSAKEKALAFSSGADLDLRDGSITSQKDAAIECDGGHFTLTGTKVQGASSGIEAKNGVDLRATKKASIVSTGGDAIVLTSNGELTFDDASAEGARRALKSTVNTKLKLRPGARFSGKRGGVYAESNLELESTGATIEGGSGAAIETGYNAKVVLQDGVVKGSPALSFSGRPQVLTIDGTRVDGDKKIGR